MSDPVASGSLTELLAARRPADLSAVAVRMPGPTGRTLTYAALDDRSAALAAALVAAGVTPGDRVAVQVAKSVEAVALHVACLRAGAVQLPLNPGATDDELTHVLSNAEPVVVVDDPGRPVAVTGAWQALSLDADGGGTLGESADALGAGVVDGFDDVPRTADDPAALLYTSGTTGRPKGALLSHGNLGLNARALVDAWGFTRRRHRCCTCCRCTTRTGCSSPSLRARQRLADGAAADRFDAGAVLELLPECTVLMGVPTPLHPAARRPPARRTRSARCGCSSPARRRCPGRRTSEFRAAHRPRVLERYGMTETSILTSNPLLGERRAGTVGLPLPGVEVRVVDDADAAVTAGDVGGVRGARTERLRRVLAPA